MTPEQRVAEEPMPTPEHVDALARIFCPDPISAVVEDRWSTAPIVAAILDAQRVLTAIVTEPTVQDAVLAALVEGGRLVEEFGLFGLGNPTMEGAQRIRLGSPDSLERALHYQRVLPRPTTVEVRLVEPKWREVGT